MKKIMILANSSVGLYAFRNELVLALLKKYEVFVSVPDEEKVPDLKKEGCQIIITKMNRRGMNPKEDLKLIRNYVRLLKEIKPDIVLTYTIKPNIYGGIVCRCRQVNYLATITGLGSMFQKKGLLKWLIVKMYRAGMKKASCIFYQNRENKAVFQANRIQGIRERLVCGSGVNLEQHIYEKYPDSGITRFLFIGRIMKEKGIEELLCAAESLRNETTVFEIIGACDEDYESVLKNFQEKGIIRWHGFQSAVHEHIKGASALILPTYHEGMSNVLMEASSTGRPVIATNISGCREIFDEGVTGFGCEPGSSESLIRALQKFLALSQKERAEMGRRAREKMEREFDRRLVTDVYINEIENILQK